MATRATKRTGSRSTSRSRSGTAGARGEHGGLQGKMRHAMAAAKRSGVHATAEMVNPKVARITIEIDWQQFAARAAKSVGRGLRKRLRAKQTRSTRS